MMLSPSEGFICPCCMVCLATSSLLQDHWIRFHNSPHETEKNSGETKPDLNERPRFVQLSGEWNSSKDQTTEVSNKQMSRSSTGENHQEKRQMFHIFRNLSVPKPTFCDFCGDIVWHESKQCKACGFLCHMDCSPLIVTLCDNWEKDKQRAEMRAKHGLSKVTQVNAPPAPKSFMAQLRHQVSRGRARHVDDSFDLDLTYVTDRIIAMSFPASGLESTYRNSLADVASMLHQKHGNKYMVFNVSERRYDISKLNNQVLDFGWPDHLAPPLERLVSVIKSIDSWLCAYDQNVAVVHCKGGKGRTGVVISAYIQFSKVCPRNLRNLRLRTTVIEQANSSYTKIDKGARIIERSKERSNEDIIEESPQAALDWFALRRFYDTKFGGVTQPSQRRYVHYFGDLLEKKLKIRNRTLILNHVILHGLPNFDGRGGCKPFLKLYHGYQQIFTSEVYVATYEHERICIDCEDISLTGDVMVKCSQKSSLPSLQDTIFRCQFHVDAIKNFSLVFSKKDLDEAWKDRRFPANCTVEFIFKPTTEQELQEENIVAAFTSLSSDSGIDSPAKHMSESTPKDHMAFDLSFKDHCSCKGPQSEHMASDVQGQTIVVPRHYPGPINGNPCAIVDRTLFGSKSHVHARKTQDTKMSSTANSRQSFDISKGIKDLDGLLSELGYLSASCKRDTITTVDQNSNITQQDENANIKTDLPTITIGTPEISKSTNNSQRITRDVAESTPNGYAVTVSEVRVKPRLPPRTSSFGAVSRHSGNSLRRAYSDASEDGRSSCSSTSLHAPVVRNQSIGSDDVFSSEGPVSPTVTEMLNELAKSPLSPENARRFWQNRRPTNLSTNYENVSDSPNSEPDPEGEFRQGRVKDHVRQFNRILSSPDPSKVGTGVPMPGLVLGINYEDKISKYNARSLAPGQCGPTPDKLLLAGSPPKRIVYEHELSGPRMGPIMETEPTETLFIPSYADRPAAYYLERAKVQQQQQELQKCEQQQQQSREGGKVGNGHVPRGRAQPQAPPLPPPLAPDEPLHVLVHNGFSSDKVDGAREDENDMRPRSDSAYGESVKGSSIASTPVAVNAPAIPHSPKNDNGKSSGRGSHTSSVTSMDDQDSSGYARIEDIQAMKEKHEASLQAPVIKVPEPDIIQEQEVIAVSHTVPEESFPERLNKRVPEIRTHKDLSLAVYQSNYLPGLTYGQPTILSSSEIDLEEIVPQQVASRENMSLDLDNDNVFASSPATLSPDVSLNLQSPDSGDSVKKLSVGSDGSLGPGIHLVDSPPSPAYSAKSDSSSLAPSPTRQTLRHRLRRSNSSTSSLSSSELFPEVVRYPHVRFDKDNLKFWYKPKITRDQAIALLKDKAPGAFVVRDSQSYDGAFGLAVKVSTPPIGVIQQAGGDLSKINMDNELIRHFLIEPCKQGVRLKGSNNEPAFPSLVALIFQHSVTKMALPIELVLPTEDIENIDQVDGMTEQQVIKKGAACNLVYLASIDVEGLSGDGAIKYAINKVLSTNFKVKSTIVTIKVDQDGITLTDNERRIFFRKHYIMKDVLCCMMDPRGRRFNLQTVIPEITHEAPCFGIVVCKPQKPMEHEVLVFGEMEPTQPATAVIDFVHRAMKNGKK